MARRRLAVAGLAILLAAAVPSGAAAQSYGPSTVIVKFRRGASVEQRAGAVAVPGSGRSVGRIGDAGANVVRVTGDPARVAARIARDRDVVYAEPNRILSTSAAPDDPLYSGQYGLHNTGQTGGTADADIDAPEGWDAAGLAAFPATGGPRVGIVDTGIDAGHPDLAGKRAGCATSSTAGTTMQDGVCADDNGHGTHMAGTISANANNAAGVVGVAFNSPLVICKALGTASGVGLTSDIVNCLEWTSQQPGVKVISMSIGGPDSATLHAAIQNASARGALLIAAAGNDGGATLSYPAAYPEVVSVAATDDDDAHAAFSNANDDVEIAAPGDAVRSTFPGGTYAVQSGTSVAAPHVAGVAALLFHRTPAATAAEVRSALTAAVDDLGPAGRDPSFGFGRVNLCKAMGGSCAYTPARRGPRAGRSWFPARLGSRGTN